MVQQPPFATLKGVLARLFLITSTTTNEERKQKFLNIATVLVMIRFIALQIAHAMNAFPGTFNKLGLIATMLCIGIILINTFVSRKVAAIIFVSLTTFMFTATYFTNHDNTQGTLVLMSLSIPIFFTSNVGKPWQGAAHALLLAVWVGAVLVVHGTVPAVPIILTILMLGLVSWLVSRMLEQALAMAKLNESRYLDLSKRLSDSLDESKQEVGRLQEKLLRRGKLEALNQFSSAIAHDMRNPLGVISNAVYILERKINDGDGDNPLVKPVRMIKEEIARAIDMLSSIREKARMRDYKKHPVKLVKLLERKVKTVEASMSNGNIIMTLDTRNPGDPGDLTINGNQVQLERVFSNLIDNAIEAGANQVTINIAIEKAGVNEVQLTISDNGPGIPDDIVDRIFVPLVSSKHRGLGLGLPISKEIIEHHGGTIDLTSTGPQGTTFTITLPLMNNGNGENHGAIVTHNEDH